MRKFKTMIPIVAAMLIVALLAVACSPSNVNATEHEMISLFFGTVQAKAVDTTAYTSSGEVTIGTPSVNVGNADDYYWAYAAVKADDYFTNGATYGKDETPVFVNCVADTATYGTAEAGKGLGGARSFSKGSWTFTLRAYSSIADRTAGTNYIFEGNTTTETLTSNSPVAFVAEYNYIEGDGTVNFTSFTTEVVQTKVDGVADTYKVTKVEAIIGEQTIELTTDSTKDVNDTENSTYKQIWTGSTGQNIDSGLQTVELKIYVADEDTARATNSTSLGKAAVLHGLATDISGTAKVTLSGADIDINFTSSLDQPITVSVGDTLTMGKIPASDTTYGGQDITWKVLSVDTKNKRALVISEKVLTEMVAYTEATSDTIGSYSFKWSDCSINEWLNNTGDDGFVSQYGLNDVAIESVSHKTSSVYGEESWAVTSDEKVFVLSVSEAETYFSDKTSRIAYNLAGEACSWWLRYSDNAVRMASNGTYESTSLYATYNGKKIQHSYGVRPAFWINIE